MRTSWRFRSLFVSSAIVALAPTTPDPGTASLVGSVELLGTVSRRLNDDNLYAYEPPRSPHEAPPRTAVVYLEDLAGLLRPNGELEPKAIDQRNETFVPHLLPVQVGTRVDFPNSDSIYHNVFSLSKTKKFDLGRYPKGASRSVVFDEVGVVRVFCEIHSHMSAFIVVLPHSYFDTTNENGTYRIDDIPPGRYRVVAWSDPLEAVVREVELAPGEQKNVDFTLASR